MPRVDAGRAVLALYTAWAAIAVGLAFLHAGPSHDNLTRVGVIALLAVDLGSWAATRSRAIPARRSSFVWRCALRALAVELCYMISRPVFPSLLWRAEDPPLALAQKAALDFAFTLPAYGLIFSVFWALLARFRYQVWQYALIFSLAQALGDGNAFFRANPAMLLLAPYVMLNYQACQLVPYLRVREQLPARREAGVVGLVLPLVVIPAVYWVAGALIIVAGQRLGLR